ncbi:hypothetical protein [Desulfobacter sp.]|uniref:hypothetical protein n=1 Tax=Desulfobacter sp. TaxID=2294 RepID=UPI00257D4E36|nr:hypothetical protein [Desulfobacter sp.]
MPKRSNHFQRLVALLHERLDKNWVVNESEMLVHTLTGEEREVDIVCKSKLGEHEVIVSIECTDTKRPAGSLWVDSMRSKHEFLPTSKLILWSGNGFYKPALILAEKCSIETVSPENEVDIEWAKFANVFKNGTIKLIQPVLSQFFDYEDSNGKKCRLDEDINYAIHLKDLDMIIHVNDVKDFILENKELRTVLLDHATESNQDFWLKFDPGTEWTIQKEDGDWVKPFRTGFGIKANTQIAEMISKSVKYGDSVYTLSTGKSSKGRIELFFKERKEK